MWAGLISFLRHYQTADIFSANTVQETNCFMRGHEASSFAFAHKSSSVVRATGELLGSVYGRMRDCVYVTHATHVAPVATALRSCVKLATTLVTENRAAAVACLDYVTKHKAGCLKCLIVEERHAKPPLRGERSALLHAWRRDFGALLFSECVEVLDLSL